MYVLNSIYKFEYFLNIQMDGRGGDHTNIIL